jgi:hypothetical protein
MIRGFWMLSARSKNHRSCFCRIIKWLQVNYPDMSDQSVWVVTIKEKASSRLYFFPANNYDLVYAGRPEIYHRISCHLEECKKRLASSIDHHTSASSSMPSSRDLQLPINAFLLTFSSSVIPSSRAPRRNVQIKKRKVMLMREKLMQSVAPSSSYFCVGP